jgi:hypothetical protein
MTALGHCCKQASFYFSNIQETAEKKHYIYIYIYITVYINIIKLFDTAQKTYIYIYIYIYIGYRPTVSSEHWFLMNAN